MKMKFMRSLKKTASMALCAVLIFALSAAILAEVPAKADFESESADADTATQDVSIPIDILEDNGDGSTFVNGPRNVSVGDTVYYKMTIDMTTIAQIAGSFATSVGYITGNYTMTVTGSPGLKPTDGANQSSDINDYFAGDAVRLFELTSVPTYDSSTNTITYQAKVKDQYAETGITGLELAQLLNSGLYAISSGSNTATVNSDIKTPGYARMSITFTGDVNFSNASHTRNYTINMTGTQADPANLGDTTLGTYGSDPEGIVSANAPVNSSTAELTQKATLNADKTQYTVTVNLSEFSGLADASGIRRYGWSTTQQFGNNINVTAPNRSILGRTYATTGSWSTVFESGKYQELTTAASTQTVSMTLPFSTSMPTSLYLYVQDDLGNTREIIITPQWSDKTITFDLNGGNWSGSTVNRKGPVDNSGAIINPDIVWPANPTQNGKIFVGWWSVTDAANINDTGTVRYFKQYSSYTDGEILHAVWVDDTDSNGDGIADALQTRLTYTPSTVQGGSINVSAAGQTALAGSGSATGKYSKDNTTGVVTETLNRGNLTYTQLNNLYVTNISQWDSASTADAVTVSLKKSLGAATLTADMIPSANASQGYSFYGWNPTSLAAGNVNQDTNYTAQFTAVIPTGILLGGGKLSVPAVLTLLTIGVTIAAGIFMMLKKRRTKNRPRQGL